MRDLFASGRVVDLILALVALETIGLALLHRSTGRLPRLAVLLPNLAAGAFLLLAVRAALVGADWVWVAASLLGALVAHLADLATRVARSCPKPQSIRED
ncbi:hypothetical protein PQJ75_04065 [Rhodoplanes sp. TEM]|uniref:Holin n=1 Tax=Rhodoplanes tepidamans TaxID=200616 RepID=A0ABT5J4R6_RHOTP|nr:MULTISPECIES: hypothetical protein [Rhodoplanes]MDC7784601.1 hypothetical protein [Rhodoplanes tepidamans]MDC7982893.1 hypothetical protein [Rhodoplanes sp. TEM]MDQ0355829.1 hypothetical protein [Rhodoplanes tepidamans]